MAVHPALDLIEETDHLHQLKALVRQHALSTQCQGRIRDIGAGGDSLLDNTLENQCRPDHWDMGSLAQPEDLFVSFRQALQANLEGKSTATGMRAPACTISRDRLGRTSGVSISIINTGNGRAFIHSSSFPMRHLTSSGVWTRE